MAKSTVFLNNRSQAVRLPAEARFPDSVKKVEVLVLGVSRVITPVDATWDSFFASAPAVTDDFMAERNDLVPTSREPF